MNTDSIHTLNYEIGSVYRYPESNKRFVLKSVSGWIFRFECGHWCTDTVFSYLINVKTGISVCNDKQLSLF